MLHQPATSGGKDPAAPFKMRLGIWMFVAYSLFYAGFVAINLIAPQVMGFPTLAGLNLATVYGFALIVVALIEALTYDAICHRREAELARLEHLKSENETPEKTEA